MAQTNINKRYEYTGYKYKNTNTKYSKIKRTKIFMRFDTNKMHKNMQSQNTAQTIHVLYANAWESVEKPNETKK